jgi:hypothetical protein
MKTITLTAVKETTVDGKEIILTSYDLLKSIINNVPQGGFTPEAMQQRLKLLSVIDKERNSFVIPKGTKIEDVPAVFFEQKKSIKLEDADYEVLKDLAKEMKWGILSSFIYDTVKQFN